MAQRGIIPGSGFEQRRGRGQIIETRLYSRYEMGWSVVATFIPGTTNQPLMLELEELHLRDATLEPLAAPSLREIVLRLLEASIHEDTTGGRRIEKAREWISTLNSDDDLLLDDSIIVHGSPPQWESLTRAIKVSPEAALLAHTLITGGDLRQMAQAVVVYGGARIFLRIVMGTEQLIGAVFDNVRQKTLPDYRPDRGTTLFIENASHEQHADVLNAHVKVTDVKP